MSSNGVYTDITRHNWAQAGESFELNYDYMHMYYWKFDLFLKYVTPLLFFKGIFLDLGWKRCYESAVELCQIYMCLTSGRIIASGWYIS